MTTEQVLALARQLMDAGQFPQAESICRQVLTQMPQQPEALYLLGLLAIRARQLDDAVKWFRASLDAQSGVPEVHFNLGEALRFANRNDEAMAEYRRAIELRPAWAEAHSALGIALAIKDDLEAAAGEFERAIELKPDLISALNNLGNVRIEQERLDDAVAAYRRAIELQPNYSEALLNLGGVYTQQNRSADATACYEKVIALRPSDPLPHLRIGMIRRNIGDVEGAMAAMRRALQIAPNFAWAHSTLLFTLNLDDALTPEQIFQEHRQFAARHEAPLKATRPPPRKQRGKIRVGYVSPNFRQHSVASFLEPAIKGLDRERFEVSCYAAVRGGDAVTARMKTWGDQWKHIHRVPTDDVAKMIRDDQIDLLIDLAGHTSHDSMQLFARRPALVQATWLGYPNTTGLDAMDYRITDAHADPPGTAESLHIEKLLRLENCFLCFTPPPDSPPVAPPAFGRNGHIIFGVFNDMSKIRPKMIQRWCDILRDVPTSRIVFKNRAMEDAIARERLLAEFSRRGIAPHRISMLPWEPSQANHLARYAGIDISLDTYPYHGTTTTCESLWMSVPVITLAGRTHVSRVAVSLLTNVGVPELIATTPEDYVSAAISLARDVDRLRRYRQTLRDRMLASPLMDDAGFSKKLAAAYESMVAG